METIPSVKLDQPPDPSPPPAEPLDCQVVTALDRIFDSLSIVTPKECAAVEIPLTFSEVRAIRRLPLSGAISMRTLALSLGVSLPAATHLVDRLVEKSIVVRSRPDHDRRVVLVELSDRSRTWRHDINHRRARLIHHILEPLAPAARQQFVQLLSEIADSAEAHEASLRGRPESCSPSSSKESQS